MVSGTSGQTLRHDGTSWEANSTLYNSGTNIGIGTSTPESSAILDLSSTTQGLLPPRMTTVQRDAISSPVSGLLIFNNTTKCLEMYGVSSWVSIYCDCATIPGSTTFSYTGAVQTFTVPCGVSTITIEAWGAQGGTNATTIVGGAGGFASGDLAVIEGDVLNIYVGGQNGYNGGGNGGVTSGCSSADAGVGGGASDIRLNGSVLGDRIVVAAGGGGAGGNRVSGCGRGAGGGGGGGFYGGGGGVGGHNATANPQTPASPGTQISGGIGGATDCCGSLGNDGSLGLGGSGGNELGSGQGSGNTGVIGGDGGGLIGEDGNLPLGWTGASGAGGSSYIGGVTSGSTTSGVRLGDGQVIITW